MSTRVRAADALQATLDAIWGSVLRMHVNRLLRAATFHQELFIYECLLRHYASVAR